MDATEGKATIGSSDEVEGSLEGSDYEAWVQNPENLANHLEGILHRLKDENGEHADTESIRRRWPYLVDRESGHLKGYQLCWICVAAPVHTGQFIPAMRACRWCLAEDRHQASRLGLVHLLPVFNWPYPPVRDAALNARSNRRARAAVAHTWSAVSLLDQWRRDSVQLAYSWMAIGSGQVIDLYDWQLRLTVGANRSRACWAAYVTGYFPELAQALLGSGAVTSRLR